MGNATSLKHHVETAEKTGVIQLSKTNLRDIPKELNPISDKLRTLDLSNNRLQRLNESIHCFKNLKILNLNCNKLKNISPSIGELNKLETLLLENNYLEDLPKELSSLVNLKVLNLSSNKFVDFPKNVSRMASLELLDLSKNEITNIPDEVGDCQANEINLNYNRLNKLNEAFANCQRLKILRLDNNQIELTSIPKRVLADSKICLLSLENNPFTLKQLQALDGYDEYSQRYTSTKRKMF